MRIATSADGKSLAATKIVPTPKDFEEGIQTIKKIADELTSGEKIGRAAGGIAGALDKEKTGLAKSPHASGWAQKPLKIKLEEILGTEIILENDAAIDGLGEACFGAGRDNKIVAYITIGTGVGGVRVVDGQIDKNALGFEPGHQIIEPSGNPCDCGGKGHLETYIGGSYIEKTYLQKGEAIKDPQVWDQVAKFLAIGLTNVVVHWSPDVLILGGSVSQSIPQDKVSLYLRDFLTIFPTIPPLKYSILGKEAGLLGALRLLS